MSKVDSIAIVWESITGGGGKQLFKIPIKIKIFFK